MTEEEKFQLIDDYVNGNLTAEQQTIFNQELQNNPQLAEEVELHQDLLIGINKTNDQKWKNHFALLENNIKTSEEVLKEAKTIQINRSYYWFSGVAACLLIGLFFYFMLGSGNKNDKLFAEYYAPYMIATVQRNEAALGTKEQAMQAYENADYNRAVELFKACLSAEPQEISCTFYLGLAYIETQQLSAAGKYLDQAVNQPANDFTSRAKWYLALVYLKQEQTGEAIALLKQLRLEQGFYSRKAAKLLQEL